MQIVCLTTSAATQVVRILLPAGLRPILDYEISPEFATMAPIIFTMICALSPALLDQIRVIPDTTIFSAAA